MYNKISAQNVRQYFFKCVFVAVMLLATVDTANAIRRPLTDLMIIAASCTQCKSTCASGGETVLSCTPLTSALISKKTSSDGTNSGYQCVCKKI